MRKGTIKLRHQDLYWFGYEALLRPTPLLEYPTRDFTMSTSSLQTEKTVYTSLTFMAAKLKVTSASECLFVDFLSEIELKKILEALKHQGWVDSMQEQLNQFCRNKVGLLNKERLIAQGYMQEEGIDYDETFSLDAKMEAIRIFLAYATYMNFKVFQRDVKSAFMNGKLKEEVYV
ncbi:retrovirus-related pol polyprotein from transposon TNT 1-94 [Tanacetum coccineum]